MKRRDFLISASAVGFAAPALFRAAVLPALAQAQAPAGASIVRAAIFPAIGFSRVGNGNEWFLAPEVPGLVNEPAGGFKQGPNRIKKQVQRFRVYGYDDQGRVVRELGEADGLRWTVHVANSKAAWYGYSNAMDGGDKAPGIPGALRNAAIEPARREDMLVIDAGPVRIEGASKNTDGLDAAYRMAGRFWKTLPVTLGHLGTDEAGRLLVFPADGISNSALPQNPVRDFTNNDGWHDDWCDGWVKASVRVGGTDMACEPAWVVCCGPKFAPQIEPIVSLYDAAREAMIASGHMRSPSGPVSFRRDVLPILRRSGMMQWIVQASYLSKAWTDLEDLSDPVVVQSLADPAAKARPAREKVLAAFRKPGGEDRRSDALPPMLGDGVNFPGSPAGWLALTPAQYAILSHWAKGEFTDDLNDAAANAVEKLDDMPLSLRPEALTRAALDACSGGAFHPGVEITWPIRHAALYRTAKETPLPFRIAISTRKNLVQDVGLQLNPQNVFSGHPDRKDDGAPVGPQAPGDLTRWMGVPWQGDAFSCQSVLTAEGFPTPVWWPALLPVDVLPEGFYQQMMRADLSAEERLRFYHSRVAWSRGSAGVGLHVEAGYTDGLRRMIELWTQMGVVVRRTGPKNPRAFPKTSLSKCSAARWICPRPKTAAERVHQVVILGAGMAGMACARTLLQRGCRPLLVAPSQDTANRGETLSFRASPHLERLGWLGLLDAETAIACQGRYTIWGSATLRRDSFHRESESGWHIDRQQLESRMAKALDTDDVARHSAKARRLSQTPAHVVVDLADGSSIEAAFVIDCSGRASVTAGGATPMRRLDKLVACYAIFELEQDVEAMPATLVEAVAAGWWYMSVMPGNRILLCFFTDSDLLPAGLRNDAILWADIVSHTHAISARVASLGIDPAARPHLQFAPASTTTMSKLIDHRIIRAGDAASALDPLGANGLATALWSGVQAAEAVTGALVRDDTASRRYERQFLEGIASHLITQRAIYASEHRFPGAPFWQRRNDAPLESTSSPVET